MQIYAFVRQSQLTSTIDKLLAHFPEYKFKNKINRNDITHFNNVIRDADIFVQSELRFLREFMDLHKDIEMIYLDL